MLKKLTKEEKKSLKLRNLEREFEKDLQDTEAEFNEKNGIHYTIFITITDYNNGYKNFEFDFEDEEFVDEIPYYDYAYHIKDFAVSYYNSINKTFVNKEIKYGWQKATVRLVKHYTFFDKNGDEIDFVTKTIREKSFKK